MTETKTMNAEAGKTRKSESYLKAKSKAEDYIKDPERLSKLIGDATKKAARKTGPLKEVWGSLTACFRLINAYATGTYREIPWSTLVMIVASVIYFVMPVDLIPDFIVGLGLTDDVALLGWTIKTFRTDINDFVRWESREIA